MTDADRIGAEAEKYLRTVALFAAYGADPHAKARTRARLAREREATADAAAALPDDGTDPPEPGDPTDRERRRAERIAARLRKREQLCAPFRFGYCPSHGTTPCPDDCPTYRDRLRAAGIDR
jgi:hypothetical protein